MGTAKELTEEEGKSMDELRKRMKPEMEPEMYDDVYLFHRFLSDRDFNIDNAETMLKKHLRWRERHDVKNIFKFKKPEVYEKFLSCPLIGYDKEGCPVRFCAVGNMDFIGLVSSMTFEDALNIFIYEMERNTEENKKQSKKLGRNVDQCVYIGDFRNLSFSQATNKKCVYYFIALLKIYLRNYPNTAKIGFGINVPIFFSGLYSLLKTLVPSKVFDRMRVYSDDSYKEDILEVIDADALPAFLGGNLTDPDGNPMCHTFINHGGEKVPEKYFIDIKKPLSQLSDVEKIIVPRASSHEVKLEAKDSGSFLEWEFQTACRDIGFGLVYNEMIDGKENMMELIPVQRIETEEYPESGTLKCERVGTYVVVFDNTYSWVREKEIYYKVKIVSPKDLEATMKN